MDRRANPASVTIPPATPESKPDDQEKIWFPMSLRNILAKKQKAEGEKMLGADDDYEKNLENYRINKELCDLSLSLGARYAPDAVALSNFQLYTEDPKQTARQQAVVTRLKVIATELADFVASGRGLVFYGAVGTGKDHLLAAMLYQAVRVGCTARWINGQELYGRFRDNINSGEAESDMMARWMQPAILAISDPIPPAAAPSPWNLQQLYRLLDRRYRNQRSTWVTLNALDEKDADAKLTSPVFDRLREGAETFRCFWESFRSRVRP